MRVVALFKRCWRRVALALRVLDHRPNQPITVMGIATSTGADSSFDNITWLEGSTPSPSEAEELERIRTAIPGTAIFVSDTRLYIADYNRHAIAEQRFKAAYEQEYPSALGW